MSRRYFESTAYGDESSVRTYERTYFGAPIVWASGAIQIFDTDAKTPLPGFVTPVVSERSIDHKQLLWRPKYGAAAGQLRPITSHAIYYVRWTGVTTDGGVPIVAELIAWSLRVR